MDTEQNTPIVNHDLKCKNCGAGLTFVPGTHSLVCGYCNAENEITSDDTSINSYDYYEFINDSQNNKNTFESHIIKCNSCGATTSLQPNITSDKCPFCAAALIIDTNTQEQLVKPHYILPFVINRDTAAKNFKIWLSKLKFAPFGLGKAINQSASSLTGVYLPHWTFDSDTETTYTGQRGDYYYTTETYTETVDGREQIRTREVRHTNWSFVNGIVECSFENLMVPATTSLTEKSDEALKPWDIKQLVHFDERYLSGFRSETYQIKPEDGFNDVKRQMEPYIKNAIIEDIGGDEQRIENHQDNYNNIGIKYILLPVWISSYKYKNKVYQFIVNANTGWVTGERPLSWLKIFIYVLIALAIIAIFVLGFMGVKLT